MTEKTRIKLPPSLARLIRDDSKDKTMIFTGATVVAVLNNLCHQYPVLSGFVFNHDIAFSLNDTVIHELDQPLNGKKQGENTLEIMIAIAGG